MSVDTCIAYFGLRFDIGSEEVEGLELRSDPRVVAARRNGLKYYWGNFGGLHETYLLFVGAQLGVAGGEHAETTNITLGDLREIIDKTTVKLAEAGFDGKPSFYLQWQPDV